MVADMTDQSRKNRYLHQSRGQWQVARERLHLEEDKPTLPDMGTKTIGDVMDDVFKKMRLTLHARTEQIAAEWPKLVGLDISRNTRPAHLENGVLTVYVNHPAWLYELRGALSAEILARIQKQFGTTDIKTIRWTVDPEPPRPV